MYVKFYRDVACQKLLKSANVSRSYSKDNSGKLDHSWTWVTFSWPVQNFFWNTVYTGQTSNDVYCGFTGDRRRFYVKDCSVSYRKLLRVFRDRSQQVVRDRMQQCVVSEAPGVSQLSYRTLTLTSTNLLSSGRVDIRLAVY